MLSKETMDRRKEKMIQNQRGGALRSLCVMHAWVMVCRFQQGWGGTARWAGSRELGAGKLGSWESWERGIMELSWTGDSGSLHPTCLGCMWWAGPFVQLVCLTFDGMESDAWLQTSFCTSPSAHRGLAKPSMSPPVRESSRSCAASSHQPAWSRPLWLLPGA